MNTLETIKKGIDRSLALVCIALFMFLVVIVSWQVFARQIFDSPSQWSETLSRYIFVWVGFLGAALVFGERGHVAIDVGVRLLPRIPQKIVGLIVQAIVVLFSGSILIYGGSRAAANAWNQNLSGIPTPVGPWYVVLPIAGVLIILYSIYHTIKIMNGTDTPFSGDVQEVVASEEVARHIDDAPAVSGLEGESREIDDQDSTSTGKDKK